MTSTPAGSGVILFTHTLDMYRERRLLLTKYPASPFSPTPFPLQSGVMVKGKPRVVFKGLIR